MRLTRSLLELFRVNRLLVGNPHRVGFLPPLFGLSSHWKSTAQTETIKHNKLGQKVTAEGKGRTVSVEGELTRHLVALYTP